jgi:hypothetical protein
MSYVGDALAGIMTIPIYERAGSVWIPGRIERTHFGQDGALERTLEYDLLSFLVNEEVEDEDTYSHPLNNDTTVQDLDLGLAYRIGSDALGIPLNAFIPSTLGTPPPNSAVRNSVSVPLEELSLALKTQRENMDGIQEARKDSRSEARVEAQVPSQSSNWAPIALAALAFLLGVSAIRWIRRRQ